MANPKKYILPSLSLLGISAESVKGLFLTHSHSDHAGGLETFLENMPKDSNVHNMFYCRNRAYVELRVGNNPKQAKEWMQKALDITMPGMGVLVELYQTH